MTIGGYGLGWDEAQICGYCNKTSRIIVVSENCAVAHLGYGTHMSEYIMEYYRNNTDLYVV